MNDQNTQRVTGEQQTRVIPPVDGYVAPSAAMPRRRRSDRYRTEGEEPAVQQPAAVEEATGAEPVQHPAANRLSAQPPMQRANVPYQGVPRPAALNRVQEQPSAAQQTPAVRRPVSAPGYSQRQPLGQRPAGQVTEPNRVRRPLGYDEMYAQNEEKPVKKGRGLLVALVMIVLVLGLAALGFMLLPEDDSPLGQIKATVVEALSGLLGDETEREPVSKAQAMDFSAAPTQDIAPVDVAFTLTTTKDVSGVRVVDAEGNPLSTSTSVAMDNADSRIWMLNLALTEAYSGTVQAQIMDGESWLDTGKFQVLEISAPQVIPEETEAFAVMDPTATPVAPETPAPADETPQPTPEVKEETPQPTKEKDEEKTPEPTQEQPQPTPTLEVTATPTIAPTEIPTPAPTEVPTPTHGLTAEAVKKADPSLISSRVVYKGSSKVENYDRSVEDVIRMPIAGKYITQPYGVMTYRGDAFRQNAAVGTVGDISTMQIKWQTEAGSVKGASSTYYGIGWTGQPAIIKWSKEVRAATNMVQEKKDTKALKEVIIAGMDGKIYFLDLADGQPTREAINVGYPMKGTPSLHPLGYPVMTVGQYARKMAKGTGDIGLRFYNLLNQKEAYMIDGLDGKMDRPYYAVGAFDTSALVDPASDTLITAGTNGMLYLTKMNTEFDYNAGTIKIAPESVVMKSKVKGQADKNVAVESSIAAYENYVFYADMDGVLRCVDTSSMKPVWAVDTEDSVQASISLDLDAEGNLWLYTANTLQNRKKGDVTIRRYNAMTGEESWAVAVGSRKNTKTEKITGAMASPVVGQNELSDLVIFTLSNLSAEGAKALGCGSDAIDGVTVALNKKTGKVAWALPMEKYSYSSPVAVYAENGKGWIIQAASDGKVYLMDGLTGKVINTLEIEGTIEGSPAAYGNTLVIGTTGRDTSYIYGITLE